MKRIAIHSVPRSGSTWLGNIFNSHSDVKFSYQPLFSYAFKDFLNETSNEERIQEFFDLIGDSDDPFINQVDAIEKGIVPNVYKNSEITHNCYKEVRYHHILRNLLEKDDQLVVIGLIRNPMATLYSWLKAPKEFRADYGWKVDEEWLHAPKKNLDKPEEFNGYVKWKEVAKLFEELAEEYPKRFYLLTYNDLLVNTYETVQKLFSFCDLSLDTQTIDFINKASSKNDTHAYSVFKTRKNDDSWENKLPNHIVDYIKEDLQESKLQKYLK